MINKTIAKTNYRVYRFTQSQEPTQEYLEALDNEIEVLRAECLELQAFNEARIRSALRGCLIFAFCITVSVIYAIV